MTKYEILIQIVQDMPALYNIKQCSNLHELLHHIKYLKIAKDTGVQYLL